MTTEYTEVVRRAFIRPAAFSSKQITSSYPNKKAVLSQSWPRDAPYIWVPWICGTPWLRPWLLFPTFFMVFCSDRPMNAPTKFEVRSFTRSWDNIGVPKKIEQSLDTPMLHFLLNFECAFTWIGPVNVPAKFEVRSFTCSWDKKG